MYQGASQVPGRVSFSTGTRTHRAQWQLSGFLVDGRNRTDVVEGPEVGRGRTTLAPADFRG